MPRTERLYDFDSAVSAGIKPDSTGHWPSRVGSGSNEGLILKDVRHPTFGKTVAAEKRLGMRFFQLAGRLFTFPEDKVVQPAFKSVDIDSVMAGRSKLRFETGGKRASSANGLRRAVFGR